MLIIDFCTGLVRVSLRLGRVLVLILLASVLQAASPRLPAWVPGAASMAVE
jgi:hypothetical protein